MSRIEELIKEFCPDGVEYKKLVDTVLNVGSVWLENSFRLMENIQFTKTA